MTTDTASAPSRWTARWVRADAATRAWLRAAGTAVDSYDVTCLLALAMLLVGLTIWFGIGPALTVVAVLLLAFGVAGARAAELRAADQREADRLGRGE